MAEKVPAGFFSYARSDDEHDGGYLTELRRTLEGELRAQTGEQFAIFQDREAILWGQAWRERLNSGIDSATVLIPVITPSFFKSTACRKELERFLDRERELGRNDLIFPLYYIRTPLIDDVDRAASDELAQVIAARQYRVWTDDRFEPVDSLPVRHRLADLAAEIVAALERGAVVNTAAPLVDDDPWPDDGELGFVERVQMVAVAFPALSENLTEISTVMNHANEITVEATSDIEATNKEGQPPGAKLAALERYRARLQPDAEELDRLTREYVDLVAQADVGLNALIPAAAEQSEGPDRETALQFLNAIVTMHPQAAEAFSSFESFAETTEGMLPLSSTTRPVMKTLVTSARRIVDSGSTFDGWLEQAKNALDQLESTLND